MMHPPYDIEWPLIFDDLIDSQFAVELDRYVVNNVQFFFLPGTVRSEGVGVSGSLALSDSTEDYPIFCCPIFATDPNGQQLDVRQSDSKIVVENLVDQIKAVVPFVRNLKIIRAKVNLSMRTPTASVCHHNVPHRDSDQSNFFSVIYYCNESDGDTYFDDQSVDMDSRRFLPKAKPRRGRFVIFPSNMLHAGSHPRESEYRIAINIVLGPVI